MDYELSEEMDVEVGMHQRSVLSPFPFKLWLMLLLRLARAGVLSCCMVMT